MTKLVQIFAVKNGNDTVMVSIAEGKPGACDGGVLTYNDYRQLAALCQFDTEDFLKPENKQERQFKNSAVALPVIKNYMRGHDLAPVTL